MSAPATDFGKENIEQGFATFIWRVFIAVAVLAALSVGIYILGATYGGRMAKAGQSTDPKPLEIIISNDVYSVPTNMIRHADQRVGGTATRIDLAIHWPTRSGYTDALAKDFMVFDPDKIELVFVSLMQRKSLLDMAERFGPVYRSAIETNKIKALSNDLYVAPLLVEYGYSNEKLVYSRSDGSGKPTFIARCQTSPIDDDRLLLPCETDIFIGDSSEMKVRFAQSQLARWQDFTKELTAFAQKLLLTK